MTTRSRKLNFKLSAPQMNKLAMARKNGTAVTLRLNKNMIMANGIPLTLTASEHKKIQNGNTHDINISATRIKHGGFLPALLAALPAIATAIGGISGLTGIASNIKSMVDKRKGKGRGISLAPSKLSLIHISEPTRPY